MSQASQPLFLLLASSLLFSFFLITSYGNNIDSCPSHMCGSVSIRYPFWKVDASHTATSTHDLYCGYRGLRLNCSSDRPILKLPNKASYYVTDINYDWNTLTLVDVDVKTNLECPRLRQNFTFDTAVPLFDSQLDLNISFYFNCDYYHHRVDPPIPIECFEFGENKSYVFVEGKEPDDFRLDWYQHCEEKVVTKVLDTRNIEYDLISRFGEFMNDGFVLHWRNMTKSDGPCGACEESHGRCGGPGGYDNNDNYEFSCFCSDGKRQKQHCKKDPKAHVLRKLIIGAISCGISLVLLSIIFWCTASKTSSYRSIILWREKINDNRNLEDFISNYGSLSPKRYTYSDVKKMTNSFRDKLGQGGYGCVYRAKLLDNRLAAVKLLDESKGNGEEFMNEVASISRTSHVNVVSLLGFCVEGRKRALIYEFMPNGSLEKFIYGEGLMKTNGHLGWEKLYQISIGIARGLEYLHRGCNQRILHFDIKPHNILLDEDFCPKISDFGLAKLCTKKESIISMLDARGTIGYIAPEVVSRNFGEVSHKSDVYSYGMMVLEMVGGRKNVDVGTSHTSKIYFPHWVYKRIELNEELGFQGDITEEENEMAKKMILVGLWCIQTYPSQRPPMSKVVEMLEGSIEALEIPPRPYFYSASTSPAESCTT